MAVAAGLRVGRYEVLRKLGQGGFGILYVGRDTELDREVALKFLRPEHVTRPDVVMRFLQEARSAAKINHSGIVTVFECGQVHGTGTRADGTVYIAMELLAGENLHVRLKRERLIPAPTAISIVRQMCAALQAAHDAGIVHRDLKPDNIFCVPDHAMRDGVRVKILDFGVAKLADGQFAGGVRTHSAMMLGTPNYMSPEQCKSSAKVDHRSDIYAVGCILYELVCGRRPYDGDAGEQIAKHQLAPVPVPREVNANVPEALDRLIRQMLAKAPEDRPGSMLFVDEALAAIESGSFVAAPAVASGAVPPTVGSTMFEGEHAPTKVSERRMPRTPIALGTLGVIGVGVIAGIALTRGGASDGKAIDAAVEPPQTLVAAPPPAPDAAPAPASPPTATAADVHVECLKLAADKKWQDLISCTDQLGLLDAESAKGLRTKGVMETMAARAAVALDAAVRANDVERAAKELAKIPKDSVYRHDAEVAYAGLAPATTTAKTTPKAPPACYAKALRTQGEDALAAGRDADALVAFDRAARCAPDTSLHRFALMAACRSKNAALANTYYAKLPPSTTTGIVQICVRNGIQIQAPVTVVECDADALKSKGEDHLMAGMDAAALASFEASMRCRPDASLMRLAFMAACRSKNATKAKYYYTKLPTSTTTGIAQICKRNEIILP